MSARPRLLTVRKLPSSAGGLRVREQDEVIDADMGRVGGAPDRLTGARAARAAEHEPQEFFRCSFENAPIGMTIIDLDGCYVRVNNAFCAMLGYGHEQLAGQTSEGVTHPDDAAADADVRRGLLAGRAISDQREKRYLHVLGHVIWAAVSVTLIRDGDGRPRFFVSQVQDISERRRYERQLEHAADHDPLTGLLNRRSLERELGGHAARVRRYGATGAVLMLDLDHFKYFNDTQGHSAGDELIVRIGQALRGRLRDSDVVARLGGDEFALLLYGGDERESQIVAEALLEIVRDEALPVLHESTGLIGAGRRVTASIGIARFEDGERMTAEETLVNADLAMYQAKEAGGNRWARYRDEPDARPKPANIKWAEEIEYAINNDGFELLAQPIVSLTDNRPARYELLLRMRDRQGNVIQPGAFLYVAERLGLNGDIDRWVTRRAIDTLAEQRVLGRDMQFEINLCGRTIGDEGLLELIKRQLHETAVPPDRLIFEVTETAAVAHVSRAGAFIRSLAERGCEFALDDFGAGLGSFYYLKHLPFDYLKIDGEFIAHCAHNKTDRTLISAAVQIARDMGKYTIAECVPDHETVKLLTELGVDYGQGFHLGRPARLSEQLVVASKSPPTWAPQSSLGIKSTEIAKRVPSAETGISRQI
jgi:diguanylate cyclase (GGDEF)-like protein/PAS domain S-box-containing protein